MSTPRFVRLCLPALLLAGALPVLVRAEPPTLTSLYPAGARRGSTAEVTAEGKFKDWPVAVWTDRPDVTFRADKKQGTFRVAVAADAEPGVHWVRLHNEAGASAVRPFLVGTLPEVTEREPNDAPDRAQALESSAVTVNGRLARNGDVDVFALPLRKGQTLVASLQGNEELKSPMDGVLQVLSEKGFVLEQNDDHRGLDPQVVFTAPRDGRYLVRTFAFPAEPNSSIRFAGGPTYIYRLTLTTGGFADHAFPLAVPRSAPGKVGVVGWNIPEAVHSLTVIPDEDGQAGTVFHPLLANPVRVRLEPHTAAVEKDRPGPQAVQVPVTLTGGIARPEETDVYTFALKKGESVAVQVEAGALGSPLDPVLRLTDGAGKAVAQERRGRGRGRGRGRRRSRENPGLSVTAPADGTYRVEVRDLHGRGGMRFVYLLRLAPPAPDFNLEVAKDRFTLAPGKALEIPVTVERQNGFRGKIEITAEGLPPGVSVRPVTASDGARSVKLTLQATGKAAGGFRIVGQSGEGPAGKRLARGPVPELSGKTEHLWLTATGSAAKAPAPKK